MTTETNYVNNVCKGLHCKVISDDKNDKKYNKIYGKKTVHWLRVNVTR